MQNKWKVKLEKEEGSESLASKVFPSNMRSGQKEERNQRLGKKITLMADKMGKLRKDNVALQAHLNNTTIIESETRKNALQLTFDDLNQRILAQRNLIQTKL